jgi:hypothetical protein
MVSMLLERRLGGLLERLMGKTGLKNGGLGIRVHKGLGSVGLAGRDDHVALGGGRLLHTAHELHKLQGEGGS